MDSPALPAELLAVADLPKNRNGELHGVPEVLDALHKRGLPPEPEPPISAPRVVEEAAGAVNPNAPERSERLMETLL
jgi:hypothetical protein